MAQLLPSSPPHRNFLDPPLLSTKKEQAEYLRKAGARVDKRSPFLIFSLDLI